MNLERLALDGVYRATPRTKGARRFDWFRSDALSEALPGGWSPTVGSLHTILIGQIEGLHCEADHRVVTCVAGRVALVVVDVRVGSPTFGRWIPEDLDTVERVTVVIPPEMAWGFQAVTTDAALLSLHREVDGGPVIDPLDEELQISWPLDSRGGGSGGSSRSLADALPLLPDFA